MSPNNLRMIFGTHEASTWSPESRQKYMNVLKEHGIEALDTATAYADSERVLGAMKAPSQFNIHTKAPGMGADLQTREKIPTYIEKSLSDLSAEKVEIYYLHAPDTTVPLAETCEAMNALHEQGKFEKFGLSNFSAAQVQEIHDLCKAKGWVLPTVYQGKYNVLSRHIETMLFPTLRKLGICFYAYSPLAGGFLTKTPQQIREASAGGEAAGRFSNQGLIGGVYMNIYNRPNNVAALDTWADIAKEEGISRAALAYRWIVWHSILSAEYKDGVILGASKWQQLDGTMEELKKGPLSEKAVKAIDQVWESVKGEAHRDAYLSIMGLE